jgi:putative heme-binding domain-containing protein
MRFATTIAAIAVLYWSTASAQHRSLALEGNAAAGKVIFETTGQCLTCHSVNERGGTLGPDLGWIGILRTPESLSMSLINPDAQLSRKYATTVVETKAGARIEGVALNEDDLSVQLRDTQGNLRSFIKSGLNDLRREHRSLMPSYASKLSPAELADVVAYVRTLRTLPSLNARERARQIPAATENTDFLDRPARDHEDRPDLLLPALDIPRGSTIADIGSGTGYFTWRLAEQVGPAGKVYAVDVQQTMLDITKAVVTRHNLDNVEYVLSEGDTLHLPEQSLDLAFVAYAYHEFGEPQAMLSAIRRALKPGGRVFILEYAQEANRSPASPLHSMRIDDIRREIEPAGFTVDRVIDFLPVQHGVIFTQP